MTRDSALIRLGRGMKIHHESFDHDAYLHKVGGEIVTAHGDPFGKEFNEKDYFNDGWTLYGYDEPIVTPSVTLEEYYKELSKKGIIIEDERQLNMGIYVSKQPFELANITYGVNAFGISMVGTQLFTDERTEQYLKEFNAVIPIVKNLNSLINR